MVKLALMRTGTGKENPELPLQQRISSLEVPVSEVVAQINASQSSSNRHISTSFRGDYVNQAFMIKLLHRKHYYNDPTHLQAVEGIFDQAGE